MAFNLKYAIEASVFWPPADRVVSGGYKTGVNEKYLYKLIKKVPGVEGVELYYPYDFTDIKKIKKILDNEDLKVSAVGIGFFADAIWQNGGATSPDREIRKKALDLSKKTIEAAAALEAKVVVFWPAHDGYDYLFQTDYQKKWEMLVNFLQEIAKENKDINIGIEYKPKEPRTHQIISNASKALRISEETGCSNVGVIMDIGHSFLANENPAEEAVYLLNKKRLVHLHSNDNYSDWDYDMVPASVHFWENIEIFFWLNEIGYDGWINFDICPFRTDTIKSCALSIKNTKDIVSFIERAGKEKIKSLIMAGDPLESQGYLWDQLFKK